MLSVSGATESVAAPASSPVVPRVLPLFIREYSAAASRSLRSEHITQFIAHLNDIFTSRVLDQDVADLVAVLIYHIRLDHLHAFCSEAPEDTATRLRDEVLVPKLRETEAFHITRLLLLLCDLKSTWGSRCLRALKQFSDHVNHRRTLAAVQTIAPSKERLREMSTKGLAAAGSLLEAAGGPAAAAGGSALEDSLQHISPVRPSTEGRSQAPGAALEALHANGPIMCADDATRCPSALFMDSLLQDDATRDMVIRLWRIWDDAGVDIDLFTDSPATLHLYLPQRASQKLRVYRDFCFCTPRPKLVRGWGSIAVVHIKTNIMKKSETMYRFLIEGYNYGVNAVIFSDCVGYTHRNWDDLNAMEQYGQVAGWDGEMTNDYAPGAAISQYFASDGFLTIRLRAKSMFCVGFSVSAWMVFHNLGGGFPISATIFHQDADL